jgi:hypothetical protein
MTYACAMPEDEPYNQASIEIAAASIRRLEDEQPIQLDLAIDYDKNDKRLADEAYKRAALGRALLRASSNQQA